MSWQQSSLGDLIELENGYAFKSEEYADKGHFLMRIANVQQGYISMQLPKFVSIPPHSNLIQFELNQGDMLMSLTGNVGRVGLIEAHHLPAALNQRVAKIRIKDLRRLDKSYLFSFFNTDDTRARIENLANGAAQLNVSTKDIKSLTIPLPPLAEQKRIAAILDKAAEIKAKREQAIAKLDELERRAFDVVIKSTHEFLPLNQVANFQSGGTPTKDNKEYWNGDIPWISSADIVNDQIKYGRNFITKKGLSESATSLAAKGQILVVTRTGIGKVAISDRDTCYSQDIVSLNLKDSYEINFIAAAIRANKANFVKQARGATIQGITKDVLGAAKIPKITAIKQQEFSCVLNAINLERTKLVNAEDKLSELFSSLQHQAFTTGFNA